MTTGTGSIGAEAPRAAGTSIVPLAALGLALGILLSVLDQTIVAIALPQIASDLGGLDSISWIVTIYLLAATATATLYGRFSDRFGRRAVFIAAIALFTVASALCGSADTIDQLIIYRALQGIGAGALFAVPTIALSEIFPPQHRGKVQGFVGMVFAVASVGGPLLGGVVTDQWGWRWIFYINLPLGALSIALVAYAVRLPLPEVKRRIDFGGSVLLAAAMVTLLVVAEWGGRDYDWTSGTILGLSALALVLFAALGWWERRVENPILPPGLLMHPVLRLALPAAALLGALLYGSIVFLPTYLQSAFDMTATEAGLALNPYILSFVLASALAGMTATTPGRWRLFFAVGPVFMGAGLFLLSRLGPDSNYGEVAVAIVVMGTGVGLIMQLLVTIVQDAVPPADLGAATSVAIAVRGLGMSLGVSYFANILLRDLESGPPRPDAVATAIPDAFVWGLPLAVALLVVAVAIPVGRARLSDPDEKSRSEHSSLAV
jgi:EmrB/QacA subfamily drug resistance transporter